MIATRILVALSLVSLTSAQTYTNGPGGKIRNLEIPHSGESYGRILAGDFDGDRMQDIAYQVGNRVEVLLAPALHEARMTGVVTCREFVVVKGADRDRILAATGAGLVEVEWDYADAVPLDFWTHTPRSEDVWQDVRQMCTWSDGDELPHVFGLIDDGSGTVQRVAWLRPQGDTWLPVVEVDTASPVDLTHMAAFDQDADGSPELALINSYGMGVFDPATAIYQAQHFGSGLATDDVARIDMGEVEGNPVEERVVWLATVIGSSRQYLCTVGPEGMTNTTNLGDGHEYYSIATGDVEVAAQGARGVSDMVLGKRESWELTWIANSGTPLTGPAIGVQESRPAGVFGSAASSMAPPVIADFDGDGDGDVAFPIEATNKVWLQLEDDVDHEAMQPRLMPGTINDPVLGQTVPYGILLLTGSSGPEAWIDVELGPEAIPEATHLEVTAWQSTGLYDPVDPNPLLRERIPLLSKDPGTVVSAAPIPIPGTSNPPEFNGFVFVVMQLVDADSSDLLVRPNQAWPPALRFFHGQGPTSANAQTAATYIALEGVGNLFDVYRTITLMGSKEDLPPGGGDGEKQGGGGAAGCKPSGNNMPP